MFNAKTVFVLCLIIASLVSNGLAYPQCHCPTTFDYNPVCGVDGVTYTNVGTLGCHNSCRGTLVGIAHKGECGKKLTTLSQPVYHQQWYWPAFYPSYSYYQPFIYL
ncbi:turripeptide Gsp9.3 [Copidosoma floridanum]|uniref:turripeptide Gsp9.3 n=1 Tax=Copidosoma floridanum TaxID=29053 RepID=UPI000C6F9745|nr:turripeptide Gsp9.3 [Copidosoma floridanum]